MRKIGLFFKKCPLTAILAGSVILLTLVGLFSMVSGRYNFVWGAERPFLVTLITGDDSVMDESLSASNTHSGPQNGNQNGQNASNNGPGSNVTDPNATDPNNTNPNNIDPNGTINPGGNGSLGDALAALDPAKNPNKMNRPIQYIDREAAPPRSDYYDDPQKTPLTTAYPYVEVEDDYFDDVLFVGDSRIEGLHDYGGLDNATFAYKQGISVFNILKEDLKWGDKGHGTLQSLLATNSFKKIYIMIGVNELGKGFVWQFGDKYEEFLNQIHEWAPDSVIMVQGIMKVSKRYSDKSDVFNNDNINARNYMITTRMDTSYMFYLDMNESVEDPATGALNGDYTNDGLHLAANYYVHWVEWLKKHGLQDSYFGNTTQTPANTGVETESNQNQTQNTNKNGQ